MYGVGFVKREFRKFLRKVEEIFLWNVHKKCERFLCGVHKKSGLGVQIFVQMTAKWRQIDGGSKSIFRWNFNVCKGWEHMFWGIKSPQNFPTPKLMKIHVCPFSSILPHFSPLFTLFTTLSPHFFTLFNILSLQNSHFSIYFFYPYLHFSIFIFSFFV